jgi:hypothetical protein
MTDIIRNPKRLQKQFEQQDEGLDPFFQHSQHNNSTTIPITQINRQLIPQHRDPNLNILSVIDDDDLFDANGNLISTSQPTLPPNFLQKPTYTPPVFPKTEIIEEENTATSSTADAPKINEYILMVNGEIIKSGSLEGIENRVRKIIYEEDPLFEGVKVNMDDIVVLKRVGLKVGVFIEE